MTLASLRYVQVAHPVARFLTHMLRSLAAEVLCLHSFVSSGLFRRKSVSKSALHTRDLRVRCVRAG